MTAKSLKLFAAISLLACAPPTPVSGTRNRNVITREEIASTQLSNVYDVVSRLRPAFLRGRGRSSLDPNTSSVPTVYLDGQRYGGVAALRAIPAEGVHQIRFLSAADATTKYGTGHSAGVIEVVTR